MKKISNSITKNQYLFLVQGALIGIGILSFSSSISAKSNKAGWVVVLIGGLYPLFIAITSHLIYKNLKYPNFYNMCEKLYGKVLAKIFTTIFLLHYIILEASLLAGFANVLDSFLLFFIPSYFTIGITLIIIVITASNGLRDLGRLTEIFFYITLAILFILLFFINEIKSNNIFPIFDGIYPILKAIPGSFDSYIGAEIIFFSIYWVTDKSKVLKAGIIGSLITIFIYVLTTFITVGCLGWNLASRLEYPLIFLIGTRDFPVISNFEAIFIFLWSGIIMKTLACEQFVLGYCVSEVINIPYNKACIVSMIPVFILTIFLTPEFNRRAFLSKTLKYEVLFIVTWSIITLILSFIKKTGEKYEEN
ncbi:GerAB/ArcD/ProY family transporter [Clostridium hydrogeniformans]|uniref:GerAB/ArcD/ProY family transporter n=1 Tax=Clostridium hydrogeniformans TaxID=349933 RepID=UPI00047FF7F1|nr:GerAB/ArcD/ProY family transporter [Clostridium hydrogeniformans]